MTGTATIVQVTVFSYVLRTVLHLIAGNVMFDIWHDYRDELEITQTIKKNALADNWENCKWWGIFISKKACYRSHLLGQNSRYVNSHCVETNSTSDQITSNVGNEVRKSYISFKRTSLFISSGRKTSAVYIDKLGSQCTGTSEGWNVYYNSKAWLDFGVCNTLQCFHRSAAHL